MDIIQNIKYVLSERNITGSQMSRDLGFSSGSFSQWTNGRSKISIDNLHKIAEYLNVSIDYLLGRTQNQNAHKKLT